MSQIELPLFRKPLADSGFRITGFHEQGSARHHNCAVLRTRGAAFLSSLVWVLGAELLSVSFSVADADCAASLGARAGQRDWRARYCGRHWTVEDSFGNCPCPSPLNRPG